MHRISLISLICLFYVICSGCMHGFIYTNSTVPLVINMNNTSVGNKSAAISSEQLKEPVSGLGLSTEWNSRAIGDAAKRFGLTKINFADMLLSVSLEGYGRNRLFRSGVNSETKISEIKA